MAFAGVPVHLEAAKNSSLESSNLSQKNSNLPIPQKSRKARIGRRNQSSLWHIPFIRNTEERKITGEWWNQKPRKHQTEERLIGQTKISFSSMLQNLPVKPIQLLYRGFLKDTYFFAWTRDRKSQGGKNELSIKLSSGLVQLSLGTQRTQCIPNSPLELSMQISGETQRESLCISIKTKKSVNSKA